MSIPDLSSEDKTTVEGYISSLVGMGFDDNDLVALKVATEGDFDTVKDAVGTALGNLSDFTTTSEDAPDGRKVFYTTSDGSGVRYTIEVTRNG